MIVSRKFIMAFRTDKGSWTRPQIEALGIDWPPVKGWIDRVCGKEISPHDQQIFESRIGIKRQRKHLSADPWEQRKAQALTRHEATKQLDRELIAKQRPLL